MPSSRSGKRSPVRKLKLTHSNLSRRLRLRLRRARLVVAVDVVVVAAVGLGHRITGWSADPPFARHRSSSIRRTGACRCWRPVLKIDGRPRAAAAGFMRLGGDRDAVDILSRSLDRSWDPALVELFAECRPADGSRQLETAERWLAQHSDDAVLLSALGRLCERAQLWGKAQTYYEASIALSDHWRTRVRLGEMLARLGRVDEANAHLAAALKLALVELDAGRAA